MKYFGAVLFLLITFSIGSTELTGSELSDDDKLEVDKVFSKIASNNIVRSEFTQIKYIKKLNRSLESQGTLLFDSLLGIAWRVKKPFPSTTVLTQNSMFQMGASGDKSTLSTSGNETFQRFSVTLQSIFLGQSDTIMSEFHVYYLKNSEYSWLIKLIPKDSSLKQVVSALEIAGDEYIETFTIYEINNDQIMYKFDETSFPRELTIEEKDIFKS